MRIYNCIICGMRFKSYNSNPKYCSFACRVKAQTHDIDFEKAKKLYEEGKTQEEVASIMSTTQKVIFNTFRRHNYKCRVPKKRDQYGHNNSSWVGRNAIYATLHKRVEAKRGRPIGCEECGTIDPNIRYEWACMGDYYDVENYRRLCVRCHRRFDKSEKGIKNYVKRTKKHNVQR